MPVTVIFKLRSLSSGPVPRSFHSLFHPLLLNRVGKVDRAMGKILHDVGIMPPYSLSPVMGVEKQISVNQSCWVRVCLLDRTLAQIFITSLEKGIWNEPLVLGKHLLHTEEVILGKNADHPWSGQETYDTLMQTDPSRTKFTLIIESPMSFKRGDLHYPLPEAGLMFANLSRRWNMFAPHGFAALPDCSKVGYAYFDIRTKPYGLRKSGTILGMVGKLTLIMKGDAENLACLSTLLRFAFYAGIGVKTTQGMGMCRVS